MREHEIFQRDGLSVYCSVPIDFPTAALGGTVDVPTVTGKTSLEIPAGTQTGDVFTIRGKGMPSLRGQGRGDHYVKVFVEVPKKLSDEQRNALKHYSETFQSKGNGGSHPVRENFLEKAKRFFQIGA